MQAKVSTLNTTASFSFDRVDTRFESPLLNMNFGFQASHVDLVVSNSSPRQHDTFTFFALVTSFAAVIPFLQPQLGTKLDVVFLLLVPTLL